MSAPNSLPIKFFRKEVKDEVASRIEGRDVFVTQEWRKIRVDTSTVVVGPVTDRDRLDFKAEYDAWISGGTAPGTPVARLVEACAKEPDGGLGDDIAVDLESQFGILTVEQIAAYPDGRLTLNGYGRTLQRKAREFLERQKAEAAEAKVERRDADHASIIARLAALEAENAELRKAKDNTK